MKILLFVFSFFHRSVCRVKNLLYDLNIFQPQKAPLPVISIGNIAFGGSEKTPLARELASFLLGQGFKPALISRGYHGRWERKGGILSNGKNIFGKWEDSGDEPFMVAQNLPRLGIFIGKNRLLSCQRAKSLGFDVALLDDGFQHRRLFRDIDIVLYNPKEKIALREGLSSLKRANILLLKKEDRIPGKIRRRRLSQNSIFEYRVTAKGLKRLGSNEAVSINNFKEKKILAFCGIASPDRFFSLLARENISVVSHFKFPDHYPYPQQALKKIAKKWEKLKPEALLTTEKDAVKLSCLEAFQRWPAYYLEIGLEIENAFFERVQFLLTDSKPRK